VRRIVFVYVYVFHIVIARLIPLYVCMYVCMQDLLEKRIAEKGLDPASLQFYIDSFRHGISPHGGGGIGR
jgi:hypothetical protein